jgi:hypothetical protein
MRRRYQRELSDLQAVAARNLPHATDDIEFVYGLEALMAFEDGGVWQRSLVCLANGEAELDCPACDEHLLLDLDGPDSRWRVSPTHPSRPRQQHQSRLAATVEGRLVALAQAHNRPALVTKLTYLLERVCECLMWSVWRRDIGGGGGQGGAVSSPRRGFPSDLTDAQWALIEPLLPEPATEGRREKHPRREVVNAILYVVRSGCPWRFLPADLPPWQTVY